MLGSKLSVLYRITEPVLVYIFQLKLPTPWQAGSTAVKPGFGIAKQKVMKLEIASSEVQSVSLTLPQYFSNDFRIVSLSEDHHRWRSFTTIRYLGYLTVYMYWRGKYWLFTYLLLHRFLNLAAFLERDRPVVRRFSIAG